MPGPGRNQPCQCGSGRKTKHCCGERRGPSGATRPRACRPARPPNGRRARRPLRPRAGPPRRRADGSPRPRSLTAGHTPETDRPDLERLCEAIEHNDPEWGWDALTAVHKQIDTPQQRARLADAVVRLHDQGRIGRHQAAYALLNLHSKSNRFIAASLLEAVAVHVGVKRTPGGLKIAASGSRPTARQRRVPHWQALRKSRETLSALPPMSKRGTQIAGHVETAAQPGIAEARGEFDATAAKDENHGSRCERQTVESTRRCRNLCESGTGRGSACRARPSLREAISSRASALLVDLCGCLEGCLLACAYGR